MKRHLVCGLLLLSGCANHSVTAPTASPIASQTTVAVMSQKTGLTTLVPVEADGPQPPSCAWRNLVIKTHIDLGGARNDVVTLANLHRVFIQDVGSGAGYRLIDYPEPWCTGPNVMLAGQTL